MEVITWDVWCIDRTRPALILYFKSTYCAGHTLRLLLLSGTNYLPVSLFGFSDFGDQEHRIILAGTKVSG